MDRLFEINRQRIFTKAEAEQLLPLVFRLTEESQREVKHLMNCLEALPDRQSDRAKEFEATIDGIVLRWQGKVEKLGLLPKGLWLADFDNGEGYFCWKFPETRIQYTHSYQDGFSGRKLIRQDDGLEA